MRRALEMLVGGGIVYVVMAACAGGETASKSGPMGMQAAGGAPGSDAAAGGIDGSGEDFEDSSAGSSGSPGSDGSLVDRLTDPVPDASAQAVGGSRLKPKYLVADDGAKQWQGWYDSQMGDDCVFYAAGDGVTRCMPIAAAGAAAAYFSDTGCTIPLAAALKVPPCGAGSIKYAASADTSACPARYRLFTLGDEVSPTTVYSGKPGACTGQSAALYTGYSFFSIGAEIAPTTWVAATATM